MDRGEVQRNLTTEWCHSATVDATPGMPGVHVGRQGPFCADKQAGTAIFNGPAQMCAGEACS
jgi:hypothetical protein